MTNTNERQQSPPVKGMHDDGGKGALAVDKCHSFIGLVKEFVKVLSHSIIALRHNYDD